jgi:hypothetical protein
MVVTGIVVTSRITLDLSRFWGLEFLVVLSHGSVDRVSWVII